MRKAFIDIKCVDCATDALQVEKSLSKIKGVKSASVNYLIHEGFVNADDNVTKEKLKDAVKRAGYNVKDIRFEEEK